MFDWSYRIYFLRYLLFLFHLRIFLKAVFLLINICAITILFKSVTHIYFTDQIFIFLWKSVDLKDKNNKHWIHLFFYSFSFLCLAFTMANILVKTLSECHLKISRYIFHNILVCKFCPFLNMNTSASLGFILTFQDNN